MSEEDFNIAANYIQSHHQEFSKDNLLKFYGFYKQVTGSLNEAKTPKPSFFRISERSKWEAWNALKDMCEDEAREKYVNLLSELKPKWRDGIEPTKSKQQSFGVSVSCLRSNDEILDDVDKTIEDFIKEGNVEKFKELLQSIESKEELNSLDDVCGMGLIHWAADRGNLEALQLILSQKDIDINLVDGEHQTALHYASSCGHKSCISLLLKHNADKQIKDLDGNSPLDVAFDEEIKVLLC